MFTLFKGQKKFFFQKWPKYGLVLEKKIKNSLSSFFKIGGEGGVKPEMTNVIFFLFFFNEGFPKHQFAIGGSKGLLRPCGQSEKQIFRFLVIVVKIKIC